MTSRAQRAIGTVAILALAAVAYANALPNAFHFDDFHAIVSNPSIRSTANIPAFFTDGRHFTVLPQDQEYRPLVLVTYAVTAAFFGVDPKAFHAVNLLIHAGCALLLFFVLIEIRASLGNPIAGGFEWSPWLAAAIFAVHPIGSECVDYVHARSESLSALLTLASLWFYLKARRNRGQRRSDVEITIAATLLFFAMMSKVVAGVLPTFVLFLEFVGSDRDRWTAICRRVGTLAFPVAVFSIMYAKLSSPFAVLSRSTFSRAQYLYSELPAYFHYLRLFLLPTGQSADPNYPVENGPFELRVMVAATLLVFLAGVVVYAVVKKQWLGIAVAIVWFFLCLGPTSSVFPLGEIVNEHRPYLASAALAAVAADFLVRGIPWACEFQNTRVAKAASAVAAAAVLVSCIALTMARNRVWRTDVSLWEDVVQKAPDSPRAHGNYGDALMNAGKFLEAEPHLREAFRLAPTYPYAPLMLGEWMATLGDVTPAAAYLDRSIALDPNLFYAFFMRGIVGERLHEPPDRLALQFGRAVELSPHFPDGYYHLAISLDAAGQLDQAIIAARRAVELRGTYDDRFLLAFELLRKHDVIGSMPLLLQLRAEKPNDTRVTANLAYADSLSRK